MSWMHESGYGPALDHEGGVADVLEVGTDPGTPPDQLRPRVTGWRSACQCGWRGTEFHLRSDWPDNQYALAPEQVEQRCRAEWERHLRIALPGLAIHDLTRQIVHAEHDLADAVRTARATGVSSAVITDAAEQGSAMSAGASGCRRRRVRRSRRLGRAAARRSS